MDEVIRTVKVEMFIVLTSVLLVVRFLLDFLGPWQTAWSSMMFLLPSFEGLNNMLFHYTMAMMPLSSGNVNPYFQVWGVLLTTLKYSVKTGHPYSRTRQIPLMDITGSLSAANLLRLRTFSMLRTPLWLLWFASTPLASSPTLSPPRRRRQSSLRLTADYMSYEHGIIASGSSSSAAAAAAAAAADPSSPGKGLLTMDSYKYLVLGENQVLKDITNQQQHAKRRKQQQQKHRIRLDPAVHQKLITLDKIWSVGSGESGLKK